MFSRINRAWHYEDLNDSHRQPNSDLAQVVGSNPTGCNFDKIFFVLCNFRSVRQSDRNAYREKLECIFWSWEGEMLNRYFVNNSDPISEWYIFGHNFGLKHESRNTTFKLSFSSLFCIWSIKDKYNVACKHNSWPVATWHVMS